MCDVDVNIFLYNEWRVRENERKSEWYSQRCPAHTDAEFPYFLYFLFCWLMFYVVVVVVPVVRVSFLRLFHWIAFLYRP